MPKVFICYRREDSAYPAQHIYLVLKNRYGADSVVFDVDTIPIGADFREYLNDQVSRCDVLLAVIGDKWAEMLKQRIEDADDFVRIEIQAALERQIPVVPVLVGKASVPSAKNLPPEIERLAFKQAAEVRAGSDMQTHLDRLIRGLDRLFAASKAEEEQRQKEAEEAKRRSKETAKRKQAKQEAESARRAEAKRQAEEERKRKTILKTFKNTLGMEFVLIPAGSFTMGSSTGDKYEKPPHNVKISQSF